MHFILEKIFVNERGVDPLAGQHLRDRSIWPQTSAKHFHVISGQEINQM
jgi:hypothetical protein